MYDPKPTVYHHHKRRTPEEVANLWRRYGEGTGAYFMVFLCNPASRLTYIFQLAKRIVAEWVAFLGGLLRGRWCPMDNSIGEIKGAMRFVFGRLAHKQKAPPESKNADGPVSASKKICASVLRNLWR
jgi:hypothetical protein